jgi:uncharacterized membrane protein YphA (DoxX/SURF4 family)
MLLKNKWFQRILRIVTGSILIYVGYVRLRHPNMVAEHLMVLELLPWSLVNFFAMWMLCFEVFIGILIISGIWLRASSIILIGFCVLCICLISYALVKGLSMHCGCFITSPAGSPRTWGSLWQEALILLVCILLFITTRCEK